MEKICVPWRLEGVDLQKSFEAIGCDEGSLLQVLRSFETNTKPLLEKIELPDRARLTDYTTIVHGIKGSGFGIGAANLGDSAAALEKAARSGDFEFISSNNSRFIEDARHLLKGLDELFQNIAKENPKPKKDRIDPDDLSALAKACKNYDMDGVDFVMTAIETYDYYSDAETVSWLRENVNIMNFGQILEHINVKTK
jgi:hypothetical protein